jgi:hypothetical protein
MDAASLLQVGASLFSLFSLFVPARVPRTRDHARFERARAGARFARAWRSAETNNENNENNEAPLAQGGVRS